MAHAAVRDDYTAYSSSPIKSPYNDGPPITGGESAREIPEAMDSGSIARLRSAMPLATEGRPQMDPARKMLRSLSPRPFDP